MVKLNIKKGDELLFLYETTVDTSVDDLMADVLPIFNGRLKVQRLCAGIHVLNYITLFNNRKKSVVMLKFLILTYLTLLRYTRNLLLSDHNW